MLTRQALCLLSYIPGFICGLLCIPIKHPPYMIIQNTQLIHGKKIKSMDKYSKVLSNSQNSIPMRPKEGFLSPFCHPLSVYLHCDFAESRTMKVKTVDVLGVSEDVDTWLAPSLWRGEGPLSATCWKPTSCFHITHIDKHVQYTQPPRILLLKHDTSFVGK